MKKWLGLLLVFSFVWTTLPAWASLSFYQDKKGNVIVEGTSCEDFSRMMQLVDENPTAGLPNMQEPLIKNQPEDDPTVPATPKLRKDGTPFTIDGIPFYQLQNTLLSYVRDVNWKTGFHFTLRDASFFERLKMVCSGAISYTKPLRIQLDELDPDLDKHLEDASNSAVDALAEAAVRDSFQELVSLSLTGLEHAVVTDKPFLLLAIDANTYDALVKRNPLIAELMDNMYVFFSTRATQMPPEFDANTPALLKIAKYGKGDALRTFEVLAQFATKMHELHQKALLTQQQEKDIHIWRLRTAFERIARKLKIEKKAAKIAYKNPENQQLLNEISNEEKRKPTVKQEAVKLLRSYNQQQIKELLRKYYGE